MLPNKNLLTALCLLLASAGLFTTSSCNIINPTEPVPTYVHIDSFAMVHNDSLAAGSEGSFSRKITAVYAYYNNTPVGVFNLPVTFPVIADAPGQIALFPAVDINGLSGVELSYPFYAPDVFTLQPQPGATITHTAVTKYQTGTNFPFNFNFDDVNSLKFTLYPNSGGTYNIALRSAEPANVFEGDGSGHIHVANAGDTSVIISESIPVRAGVEAYMEFNFKGTVPAQIGLYSYNPTALIPEYTEYVIGINPRATWGKFYIPIRPFIASHYGVFRILVRTQSPSDQAGGDFYIDNVKVVTF